MFALAVIGIVALVFVVALLVSIRGLDYPGAAMREDPTLLTLPLIASGLALLLIFGGTLYKVLELRAGGGTLVAERLGGSRIFPNSQDPVERRLLNVVEEMALASGTPVPPVFLLEEEGINAFAAGYSPSDAVLGVTRGCAKDLTRDELQGVIAHEFSHILNGDMRMSIRLIGILHGILLLGLAGQTVFRMLSWSGGGYSRRRGKDGGGQIVIVLLLVALGLIVLGFVGTFFGNLIKAAVSRQREFLADASAVQFTRNPSGLAGALKRIGGKAEGSRMTSAVAAEASHMFFAKGVFEGFSGLWATHPPLEERIRAIEPNWDGNFPETKDLSVSPARSDQVAGLVGSSPQAGDEVPIDVLDHAVDQVGEPTKSHQEYAVGLLHSIPSEVLAAARDPYGARAVLYCLLLDRRAEMQANQLATLNAHAKPDVVRLTHQLAPSIQALDARIRLPLVDLALPALRAMCESQYREFAKCFDALVRADRKIDLFEWMLSQVLIRHLRPQFEPVRSPRIQYYGLQRLTAPCATLLSAIAYAGNDDQRAAAAFENAARELPELQLRLLTRQASTLNDVSGALQRLGTVSLKQRVRVVDACATAICTDEQVQWQEAELLRGISDLLDCPMPPLLVRRQSLG